LKKSHTLHSAYMGRSVVEGAKGVRRGKALQQQFLNKQAGRVKEKKRGNRVISDRLIVQKLKVSNMSGFISHDKRSPYIKRWEGLKSS